MFGVGKQKDSPGAANLTSGSKDWTLPQTGSDQRSDENNVSTVKHFDCPCPKEAPRSDARATPERAQPTPLLANANNRVKQGGGLQDTKWTVTIYELGYNIQPLFISVCGGSAMAQTVGSEYSRNYCHRGGLVHATHYPPNTHPLSPLQTHTLRVCARSCTLPCRREDKILHHGKPSTWGRTLWGLQCPGIFVLAVYYQRDWSSQWFLPPAMQDNQRNCEFAENNPGKCERPKQHPTSDNAQMRLTYGKRPQRLTYGKRPQCSSDFRLPTPTSPRHQYWHPPTCHLSHPPTSSPTSNSSGPLAWLIFCLTTKATDYRQRRVHMDRERKLDRQDRIETALRDSANGCKQRRGLSDREVQVTLQPGDAITQVGEASNSGPNVKELVQWWTDRSLRWTQKGGSGSRPSMSPTPTREDETGLMKFQKPLLFGRFQVHPPVAVKCENQPITATLVHTQGFDPLEGVRVGEASNPGPTTMYDGNATNIDGAWDDQVLDKAPAVQTGPQHGAPSTGKTMQKPQVL